MCLLLLLWRSMVLIERSLVVFLANKEHLSCILQMKNTSTLKTHHNHSLALDIHVQYTNTFKNYIPFFLNTYIYMCCFTHSLAEIGRLTIRWWLWRQYTLFLTMCTTVCAVCALMIKTLITAHVEIFVLKIIFRVLDFCCVKLSLFKSPAKIL